MSHVLEALWGSHLGVFLSPDFAPPPVSAHGWQREAVNSSESLAFTRCVLIKANSIDPTQPRGGCSVLRTPGAATSPS